MSFGVPAKHGIAKDLIEDDDIGIIGFSNYTLYLVLLLYVPSQQLWSLRDYFVLQMEWRIAHHIRA